jgi:hypothetical protein
MDGWHEKLRGFRRLSQANLAASAGITAGLESFGANPTNSQLTRHARLAEVRARKPNSFRQTFHRLGR